jgi:hypothetical protein
MEEIISKPPIIPNSTPIPNGTLNIDWNPDMVIHWIIIYILMFIVGSIVTAFSQIETASSTENGGGSLDLLLSPFKIFQVAGQAVTSEVGKQFQEVGSGMNVISSAMGTIQESIKGLQTIVRTFYTMINTFVDAFQRQLMGLFTGIFGAVGKIKLIFMSIGDTMTAMMYILMTSLNLSNSIMNGPPGRAMKSMVNIANAF